jgi:5'-nucleotidase
MVLLLTLGFAVALLGCDSGSNEASGGSGGAGGTGGSNEGPLRILITNDDGVGAPGIDVVVEALKDDPNNEVTVCAPAENQSSSGDRTTPTPPPLQATETTTASGYPATAVDGFPADSVIYALENLFLNGPPHVVLSGINEGQNVGAVPSGQLSFLSGISGTVGAAKTAACLGVPALASSQGQVEENGTVDYPAGLAEVLLWLEANRGALLAGEVAVENITSINIPSCNGEGEIRDTLEVPLATENPNEYLLNGPQDCTSTVDDVPNDVEAFFNGYTTITPVPRNALMTCDDLN